MVQEEKNQSAVSISLTVGSFPLGHTYSGCRMTLAPSPDLSSVQQIPFVFCALCESCLTVSQKCKAYAKLG